MNIDWIKVCGILSSGGLLWTLHCVLPVELRVFAWLVLIGFSCWGAKYCIRWLMEAKDEGKK